MSDINRIMITGMTKGAPPLRLLEEATRVVRHRQYKEGEEVISKLFDMTLTVKFNRGVLSIKGEN